MTDQYALERQQQERVHDVAMAGLHAEFSGKLVGAELEAQKTVEAAEQELCNRMLQCETLERGLQQRQLKREKEIQDKKEQCRSKRRL